MNKPETVRVISLCFSCSRLRSFQYQLVKVSTEGAMEIAPIFFSKCRFQFIILLKVLMYFLISSTESSQKQ